MGNIFGKRFTLTTFGESHGEAVGGVVDGMPPGIDIDMDFIQSELNRRKPGQSHITTARREDDRVRLHLSHKIWHTRPSWRRTVVGTHHHSTCGGRSTG